MDSATKTQIETDLHTLRNRLGSEAGVQQELVRISVNTMLTGQEAVNYQVTRIFCKDLTDQALIELIFRLGLKSTAELIKLVALNSGIRL